MPGRTTPRGDVTDGLGGPLDRGDDMCINLRGAGGHFPFDLGGWYFALELGEQYGWQPAGTTSPDEKDHADAVADCPEEFAWYTDYVANAGQRVSAADARAW